MRRGELRHYFFWWVVASVYAFDSFFGSDTYHVPIVGMVVVAGLFLALLWYPQMFYGWEQRPRW